MTVFLTDFARDLIRWIPEHFLGDTGYSAAARREAAEEPRAAAKRFEDKIFVVREIHLPNGDT